MSRSWLGLVPFLLSLLALGASAEEPPAYLASLKTDVEFAKVGDVSLTLDAHVPPGDGPFPACILVHGGGFTKGDKQTFIKPLFAPLAEAQFAWFTINYRLAPAHRWPACVQDVEAAIRWVKRNAAAYKVDPRRVALVGESAGGYLVSYVGANLTDETRVAAVVPFYAPHDLEFQARKRNALGNLGALLGITELDDEGLQALRRASVTPRPKMPPYLLIHGDKDTTVAYEQSTTFQTKMKNLGNACDLITIPAGGHGMGGWDKKGGEYKAQMTAWLMKTLAKPAP